MVGLPPTGRTVNPSFAGSGVFATAAAVDAGLPTLGRCARLLRGDGAGDSYGSASAGRVRDLTAGKLTPKLGDRIADVRGRQYPTLCSPSFG